MNTTLLPQLTCRGYRHRGGDRDRWGGQAQSESDSEWAEDRDGWSDRSGGAFPIRFSGFKMLSNNYGNDQKKGGGCICGLYDDGGGITKDHKIQCNFSRRNVPSSGEFYCARGTYPRAGARGHGGGDWGPGQRRPGQRSEPQQQHSALTGNREPGNGLDRSVKGLVQI